jgi:hydroxyacyl-ACP dehydratase HTD2-like protein with hotdog domain
MIVLDGPLPIGTLLNAQLSQEQPPRILQHRKVKHISSNQILEACYSKSSLAPAHNFKYLP